MEASTGAATLTAVWGRSPLATMYSRAPQSNSCNGFDLMEQTRHTVICSDSPSKEKLVPVREGRQLRAYCFFNPAVLQGDCEFPSSKKLESWPCEALYQADRALRGSAGSSALRTVWFDYYEPGNSFLWCRYGRCSEQLRSPDANSLPWRSPHGHSQLDAVATFTRRRCSSWSAAEPWGVAFQRCSLRRAWRTVAGTQRLAAKFDDRQQFWCPPG